LSFSDGFRLLSRRNSAEDEVFLFSRICEGAEEDTNMKRTIAGVLLLLGMGAGTMFAEDGWRERRDIRHDEVRIDHDRRELRNDYYRGNYRAAERERRELRREYRDVNRDRRDRDWDRR
jgi:hypothetical protein